ncbi:MAG TPA: pseudouridine synthase [Alphaproteobacteria bacterium]|nr:pseudouridine synthase [Alphaproteobacteria bacterium]
MRLNKYLQQAGVGSRREAERLVEAGLVLVNGKMATLTTVVLEGDVVLVNGKKMNPNTAPVPRLFLYHKPAGYLVTTDDPQGRPTIFDILPKALPRIVTVGRLDMATEGLLLLTTDGALAQTLMSPRTGLERVYRARVMGLLSEKNAEEIRKGILVEGTRFRPAKIELEKESGGRNRWYRMTLTEGKYREVRKILEACNCPVNRLVRVQYGPFMLGNIPRGEVGEVPRTGVLKFLESLNAAATEASRSNAKTARQGNAEYAARKKARK